MTTAPTISCGWTGSSTTGESVSVNIVLGHDDLLALLGPDKNDSIAFRDAYRILRTESERRLRLALLKLGHEPEKTRNELDALQSQLSQLLAAVA